MSCQDIIASFCYRLLINAESWVYRQYFWNEESDFIQNKHWGKCVGCFGAELNATTHKEYTTYQGHCLVAKELQVDLLTVVSGGSKQQNHLWVRLVSG